MGSQEPEVKPEGLSAAELEELMDKVVLKHMDGIKRDDLATKSELETFRASIVDDVVSKVTEKFPAASTFDEEGFMKRVGEMLDGKLRGISGGKPERIPGALGRWLLS